VARVQGSPAQPNLGDLKGAEASYVKAVKIMDSLTASGPVDTDVRLRDAELRLEYAYVLFETGDKEKTAAQAQRGIDQVRAVLAKDPGNFTARKLSIRLHIAKGRVTHYTDPAGTRKLDMEQLPLAEALVREYPQDTEVILDLASLWSQIGTSYDLGAGLADSAEAFRKSTALREKYFALRPQDVGIQHDLLISYGHLGDVTGSPSFLNLGDYRRAVVWYGKALAIAKQMVAADPSNKTARLDEGMALARMSVSQVAAGDTRPALETMKRATAILEPMHAASPQNITMIQNLAVLYNQRGVALNALGDHKGALASYQQGMGICAALLKSRYDVSCTHSVWMSRRRMASTLALMGDSAGALREGKISLELIEGPESRKEPQRHGYRARALASNGEVYVTFAKRAAGPERVADWHTAADFYKRAITEYQLHKSNAEPYLGEARQAQASLAECERAVQTRVVAGTQR
jgi:tetratricopeptide (TPR) repeat protein